MNEVTEQKVSNDAQAMMAFESNKKSAGVAYLLLIFLGGLGVHRFYLGKTGSGVAMLVIFIVSWLLVWVAVGLLGFIVLGVWWFVDLFLIPGMAQDHNNALMERIKAGFLS